MRAAPLATLAVAGTLAAAAGLTGCGSPAPTAPSSCWRVMTGMDPRLGAIVYAHATGPTALLACVDVDLAARQRRLTAAPAAVSSPADGPPPTFRLRCSTTINRTRVDLWSGDGAVNDQGADGLCASLPGGL